MTYGIHFILYMIENDMHASVVHMVKNGFSVVTNKSHIEYHLASDFMVFHP